MAQRMGSLGYGGAGIRGGAVNEVLMFPYNPCSVGESCQGHNCQSDHGKPPIDRLLELLTKAKKSVDVCVFQITFHKLAEKLMELHQKGVKVRIISDYEKSQSVDSFVKRIAQKKIQVRLANPKPRTANEEAHMHHKFAVIDNHVLINGSFNWTFNAVSRNHDNLMITDEDDLCQPFVEEFEKLWTMYK